MKAKLIERGGKVEALAGSCFQSYNDVAWRTGFQGNKEKHTVKGRVVISRFGFNRFEPGYAVYVKPLQDTILLPGSVTPQLPSMSERRTGFLPPDYIEPSHAASDRDDDDGGMPADGFFEEDKISPERPALTEEQKLICTPLVRGYALEVMSENDE